MKSGSNLIQIFPCAILTIIFAAVSGFAHDPGLSAVDLKFEGSRLNAHLAFSRADLETLVPIDSNRDGQVSADELSAARPQLDAIGREAVKISVDGKPLIPSAITTTTDDGNAVHFNLMFDHATGSKLQLQSLLISKMPLGHKQFLTLHAAGQQALGARMLDVNNSLYDLDLNIIAGSRQTFWGFLKLGIEHILTGYDHLAFLLALLLLGGTACEAAKIITSFTLAHSITLALATLNIINLPSTFVEPMIAASIVYVGLENIVYARRGSQAVSKRWLLTFAFGLIHGFGFASVLRELGIGTGGSAIVPLVSFNLGVEIGQIAIAMLALPIIWRLRKQPKFSLRFVPACSILIAVVGGYWLVERILL